MMTDPAGASFALTTAMLNVLSVAKPAASTARTRTL